MTPEVFVDIGALDGITNSNPRLFLSQGWKGILFDPILLALINYLKIPGIEL